MRPGSRGPTITVAASDGDAFDRDAADIRCDGTQDEQSVQDAVNALPARGGVVVLGAGTYYFDSPVILTANKRVAIDGYGAFIKLGFGATGFRVNQGNVSARGVRVSGIVISGGSNAGTVGIELRDTNNAQIDEVDIEGCVTGLLFNSVEAGGFVEGSAIRNLAIRTCTTGWASQVVSGTGSFAQTDARGVKISGCTTGINFPVNSIFQRGHIEATVWIDTGQTGASLDCNCEDLTFDLAVEGAAASTGNTGIVIGTNSTNTDQMFLKLLYTGTIATQANFNSKNLHYWSGGSQIVQSAGTVTLGYKRHGDTTDRVRISGLTAGGKIEYGNGALLDVNQYRSAANILTSDDKYDPASLNLQTKAGTPVDGDITGAAADGDIVVDTTASKIWVRIGGAWKSVAVA